MSWAKENKFLTGFIVVMVIGVGALGYKIYSAGSDLDEAETNYSAKASRYSTLRHNKPYPNRENLAKFEEQKVEAAEVINDFQSQLAKKEFPLDAMSPETFQDQLRKAVIDIRAKAQAANVELPPSREKFYLGFERYESAPPDKDAATPLGRDLKAIEWVINQLISSQISKVTLLKRVDIPEEKAKGGATSAPKGPGPGSGPKNRAERGELVSSHAFDLSFISRQRQGANVLNALISPNAPQFLIPRTIRVTNSKDKGPLRNDPTTQAAPPPEAVPAVGNPAGTPGTPAVTGVTYGYVVGEETNEFTLHLEIVDFAQPAAAAAK